MASSSFRPVSSEAFYSEYHGHKIEHLSSVHRALGTRPRVWLVGDSTLDNKYWLPPSSYGEACNGYERVLDPPKCRRDVCYALNELLQPDMCCINGAVEESSLGSRSALPGQLSPQDAFVRDHIAPQDTLIVSIGGNDIAIRPNLRTIFNLCQALLLNSDEANRRGNGWGLGYFRRLFGDSTQEYVSRIVSKVKPKRVVVCTIYFPDEAVGESWASRILQLTGYNTNPGKLQSMIQGVYETVTCQIKIEDTMILPCALFRALHGKDSALYADRVEPSEDGGKAIAKLLYDTIKGGLTPSQASVIGV